MFLATVVVDKAEKIKIFVNKRISELTHKMEQWPENKLSNKREQIMSSIHNLEMYTSRIEVLLKKSHALVREVDKKAANKDALKITYFECNQEADSIEKSILEKADSLIIEINAALQITCLSLDMKKADVTIPKNLQDSIDKMIQDKLTEMKKELTAQFEAQMKLITFEMQELEQSKKNILDLQKKLAEKTLDFKENKKMPFLRGFF
jgi:hypothetical protein